MKNIDISYKLQQSLLEKELELNEIYEDTWEEKKSEGISYLKNDVLSTAFSYARYAKGKEEFTRFVMKNSLILPSLANKYFISLRDENNEPIYTYTDPFMRHFVRRRKEGGRCVASYHYYESIISDKKFNIISKELNVNGKICDISDKYFEYTNKHRKIIEDENNSKFDNYRDYVEEERTKHVNKEFNKLTYHKKLQD